MHWGAFSGAGLCTSFLGSAASRRLVALVAQPPPPGIGLRGPAGVGFLAPRLRPGGVFVQCGVSSPLCKGFLDLI